MSRATKQVAFTRAEPRRRRAFTIVEILIAVLIIGILSAILIPVYISRTEEARVEACNQDLQHLADSQERAAIQMGYYLRPYALDDLGREGDGIGLGQSGDIKDAFADEYQSATILNTLYSNPRVMFIHPKNATLMDSTQAENVYAVLAGNDAAKWAGPYYNIHRDETVDEHVDSSEVPTHLHDIPNDPWGNDYIFIFRFQDSVSGELRSGMLVEPDGVIQAEVPRDATLPNVEVSDIFDRPAVLSLGPDGLPGDGGQTGTKLGEGDDMYRMFGY